MSVAAIILCFLSALLVTLTRGAGSALATIYIPALLFLSLVPTLPLPGVPDASAPTAAIYGILLGAMVGGGRPQLRASALDYLVVLLLPAYIITAFATDTAYAALNTLGSVGLGYVAPYFIVRCTFERPDVQRRALVVLVGSMLVIGAFSIIETRLWPDTYADLVLSLGLTDPGVRFADIRYGFFRSRVSFYHPIDLGNGAALILAAIALLAWRSGTAIRTNWVVAGLGAAVVASIAAISFTSFMALTIGAALFFALRMSGLLQRRLVVVVLVPIVVGFAFSTYLATSPLGERPAPGADLLGDSFWIRKLILQRAWEVASTAGPFGWGYRLGDVYDLGSTDNAYLLLLMQQGWVGLGLWLGMPLSLASLASSGLRRGRSRQRKLAILAGFSAAVGIMISMYTVFLGFVYAHLLLVVMALTANAAQARERLEKRPALRRSRGNASSGRLRELLSDRAPQRARSGS